MTVETLPRIGVLASGAGSNLQALLDAQRSGRLAAEIAVVVSHNPEAGALVSARTANILAVTVPLVRRGDPALRQRHEERLLTTLAPYHLDLVVLAGWMLILSADFLARCGCPLINVHPALLDQPPAIRGAHAVRDALALGVPYTGVSVHLVTPEVDAGPVLLSQPVTILSGDTETSLYDRIKTVEHHLLPQAVQSFLHPVPSGGIHAGHATR